MLECHSLDNHSFYVQQVQQAKALALLLGGIALGHRFEPQSDLELFSAKNINT
jgi:hypothetical protein